MLDFIEKIQDGLPGDLVTDTDIANLIPGSKNQRYALVKRAIARGDLIHIRRGLYCLGKRYRRGPLNLLVIAPRVYGPSYISFESALAHHGWIPEAVRSVTSATSKRSQNFETPLGLFVYTHVSSNPFLADVFCEKAGTEPFWIASPWRAIADYVYAHKRNWKGMDPLLKSLRIEEEDLKNTKSENLDKLQGVYRSQRVQRFLKGVQKDLGL